MDNTKMGTLLFFVLITSFGINTRAQCLIEGVNSWLFPYEINILDTFRGNLIDNATTNIQSIADYRYFEGLNNENEYFDITLDNSRFVVATNNEFELYEEYETVDQIAVTVTFICQNGFNQALVILIHVTDTNNNDPLFLPSNDFTYTIPTPLPPGMKITGCFDGITVRDIDLTTQKIDFTIEDNPFFEIAYDSDSSTTDKEFIAVLRSTTFIRNMLNPITLRITATDVDLTNDPSRTAVGTVNFIGDTTFELPEDPVFAQAFYFANYTKDHQVILKEPIYLQSGFHASVNFSLQGELSENFEVDVTGTQITIQNKTPLESSILREVQIFLVIRADREHTSGDTATIILNLPEEVSLEFEKSNYHGTIKDNVLQELVLSLAQGYEGGVLNAYIISEHFQYFNTSIQGNSIEVLMNELPDSIINENNVISLEVVASTKLSTASTVVILEIVRDDNVTPVFSSPIYTGSYSTETGLLLDDITFTQGYDEPIELSLYGDHSNYFEPTREGAVVTIYNKTSIPPSILNQQRILLTLQATKPRTVGASTAIVITFPAVSMEFEKSYYHGTIKDNVLQELVLPLTRGYEGGVVNASIISEYSEYFTSSVVGNSIEITMTQLPDSVVNENNVLSLEVVASTEFSTASTVVILEIVRDDNVTPVFSSPIYTGSYSTETGLLLDEIRFTQGYDEPIELSLTGDHSNYFEPTREGAVVTIYNKTSIPPSILNQQRILLTLQATKPRTVGASTAIVITFPADVPLEFEKSYYRGTIKDNILQELVLPLTRGYEGGVVNASIISEYSEYFTSSVVGNSIEIAMTQLPDSVVNENNVLSLEVVASTEFSTASTVVILEIVRDDNVTPVFSSPIYTGSYSTETGLLLDEIRFTQGYDEPIELSLTGDHSNYFEPTREGAVVTIYNKTSIPPSILNQQRILLTLQATKPRTVGASTAIVITFPADVPLEFEKSYYRGTIKDNILQDLVLPLTRGYEGGVVNASIISEYSEYFTSSVVGNSIEIAMTQLPDSVVNENNVLSLEVVASTEFSTASTVVILEIVRDDNVTPVFSSPIYTGSYSTETGLLLDEIRFTQGYDEPIELSLTGDHSNYFEPTREGAVVTIYNKTSIPPSILNQQRILLTLQATKPRTVGASTAIVITFPADSPTGNDVSFGQLVYEGTIHLGNVQHEPISISNYNGNDVILHGEHASSFVARAVDGKVTVQPNGNLNLPNDVTRVVLELHAANARAVLLLTVTESDSPTGNDVSFGQLVYEGTIHLGNVQHEPISISNYNGNDVILHGEHASSFVARAVDGKVTVQPNGNLNLPNDVTRVVLELHAANARAVLLLTVTESDSPTGNDVSFGQLVYEGTIHLGNVQHEPISISNYNGNDVILQGEHASSFVARAVDGKVTVQPNGNLNLPNDVTRVVLELHAANARAVLLLTVTESDSPTGNDVSFGQLVYEGTIHLGNVQHEPISISNYNGNDVILHGEHASSFVARAVDGKVTVQPNGNLNLPNDVTRVVLELHAANARAVLLLTVTESDSPTGNDISFGQLVYEGTIHLGNVQHEPISISNYNGNDVILHGEHASSFVARAVDGKVTVQPNGNLNLPNDVTRVVLELHAANARAVLLLTVTESDSPTGNDVSFGQLVYEGTIHLGNVQHEPISISNYNGNDVILHGEHASSFVARAVDGKVTVQPNGNLNLPNDVTRVVLELHAANARAVLLLTVTESDSPTGNDVSFGQLVYEGTIHLGNVQHEPISISNYNGNDVILHGEHASSFVARAVDGKVTVQPNGNLNLPNDVTRVVLELHAANARAVLLLTVTESDSPTGNDISFGQLVYEGTIHLGNVQHEPISISNYNGNDVILHGEHASSFVARAVDGKVTVQPNGNLNLPNDVTRVVLELHAANARAVLLLTVTESDSPTGNDVSFGQLVYEGTIHLGNVQHEPISISNYNGNDVILHGEHASSFVARAVDGKVTVQPNGNLNLPNDVTRVVLELHAANARAVLLLTVTESDSPTGNDVSFGQLVYEGTIHLGNVQHEPISISNYNGNDVILHGEHASSFVARAVDGKVTVQPNGNLNLPNDVTRVVLELHAANARAVLLLTVTESDSPTGNDVSFGQLVYEGTIHLGNVQHEPISISNYNGNDVILHGEHASSFVARAVDGKVTVQPNGNLNLPNDVTRVVLELHAANARAVLLLTVTESDSPTGNDISFGQLVYEGTIHLGNVQHEPISISNYNGNDVILHGEHASSFVARAVDGKVTVQPNGNLNLPNDVTRVVLELHAANARAVLLLTVTESDSPTGNDVSFGQLVYEGTIHLGNVQHEPISISNYNGNDVILHGEHASSFVARAVDGKVTVQPNGNLNLPNDVTRVVLELHAANARAVLLLTVTESDSPTGNDISFGQLVYEGTIHLGNVQHEPISISNYNGNDVILHGEHASSFVARAVDGKVTVQPNGNLNLPNDVTRVVLELHAANARAVLLLTVTESDSPTGNDVSFGQLVYEGTIHLGNVQHEPISISNYNGNDVILHGEHASSFVARAVDGKVTVQPNGNLNLPNDDTRVVLELHAANARAVLLLTVTESDEVLLPTVTFNSASYVLSVEVMQTGLIGRVLATADNGEAVTYTLNVNEAHLLARISVNQDGELFLSAPADVGVYVFKVIATTVITQATGMATAHLTVHTMTIIDDNEIVVQPLIILNRYEEEPHYNLVPLDTAQVERCEFILNNRWPLNQTWLYVDEKGLHTRAIDREHESITFMALSQVQVELILTCESDNVSRKKRSLITDSLGPYDYGVNQWILTESIPFNSRRSLVNLIVNDINDNYPIFVGKENEPIAVGYPVNELEERILPRSLTELQATDADIGENAAIIYWSSEEALAVAPTTGFVHVRTGAKLQNDQILIVNATDQNGSPQGLTGNIQLMVKLLNVENIAVVTVQNAFLDDEKSVLAKLSNAIGYELKVLRSVVISDEQNQNRISKKTRNTSTSGVALLLYVYGLINREPVAVDRLTGDINNNAAVANVMNTVSLEDHLVPVEIIPAERDIGFVVATIVLSILLFIIIVLTAIWFFLRWRKNRKNDELSNTILSPRTSSIDPIPKPETPQTRLNIEELKKSEQRLHDRLNAPIDSVTVEPIPPRKETAIESIADLLSPESSTPIVIQSVEKIKDPEETDDDEFGEKPGPRRKSVVTFNENVEKIIHLQNDTDSISSTSGYDIFRL